MRAHATYEATVVGVTPEDFRVPDERRVLKRGILLTLGVAVFVVGVLLLILRLPILISLFAALVGIGLFVIPLVWLYRRAAYLERRLASLAASAQPFPPTRHDPRSMVREICRILQFAPVPDVALISGPPRIDSTRERIYVSETFYRHTTDATLLVLLVHEMAHAFAGHQRLLRLSDAIPSQQASGGQRMLLWPIVPLAMALEGWRLWADITADRLMYILKPNIDQALFGILQQTVLTAPDSASQRHLVQYLVTADCAVDRGDQFMISAEINSLFRAHPDAEARVTQLKAWKDSPACAQLCQRLREQLAALRTA